MIFRCSSAATPGSPPGSFRSRRSSASSLSPEVLPVALTMKM